MAANARHWVPVLSLQLLMCCVWLATLTPSVEPAPIKWSFDGCVPGFSDNQTRYCCPLEYKGEIVNFHPKRDVAKPLRIRKALQCLKGRELKVYKKKLNKAYKILLNLPDEDPRSLYQQSRLHCAYGTGSFVQQGTNITTDVHFSWFFYPWHRYFTYFHERILRHVLNDPDFTLHFWNWDSGATVSQSEEAPDPEGCYERGDLFPEIYNISTAYVYWNRSERAKTLGLPVDLGLTVQERLNVPLRTADVVVPNNRAVMHRGMVTNGNNTRTMMGRPYRVGDYQLLDPALGAGTVEQTAHASTHWWTGGEMGVVDTSAKDPIFWPVHANVDRLWGIWYTLPGEGRVHITDPDYLDGEFLFYDETATIRRVSVRDSLVMEEFGYKYQTVNDASWMNYTP